MEKILNNYLIVLMDHIKTKTTCTTFHQKSESFYELLFEVFHTIMEKKQDLGLDDPSSEESAFESTNKALNDTKSMLEKMIKDNESIGMDNLLRGLVDKLDSACGDMKAFLYDEEEDAKEKTSDDPAPTVRSWLLGKK